MSAKDRVNLYIFTVALFLVCQTTQCIIFDFAMFVSVVQKYYLVLLLTRDKWVAKTVHKI